ncbi:MAG: AAA domain-containing protein [Dehalococcoidia bacterium]
MTSRATGHRADDALRAILSSQWSGEPAVIVDSPPGAGKTEAVIRLAAQSLGVMGERCAVVTQTNAQAADLARRFGKRFSRLPAQLLWSEEHGEPDGLPPSVSLIHRSGDVPDGPCLTIANAAKWSYQLGNLREGFALQVVDEAYQLRDNLFHQIAQLADRIVLVGDPGQIAPVVPVATERWADDPAGPQVAAPRALLHRHPNLPVYRLPVSYRLVPDTVEIVQPAFYPDLPFAAATAPGERRAEAPIAGMTPLDRPITLLRGASLVLATLPARQTGDEDDELAGAIVRLAERLIQRAVRIRDPGNAGRLTPERIGVVCAHVAQVAAVRSRLPPTLSSVRVETADRFQGLDRDVTLVWHPLSGRRDLTGFQLDAGRLCVMLSRHRVGCILVGRAGLDQTLDQHVPTSLRTLDGNDHPEFIGWRAHREVLARLRASSRIVPIG